MIFIDVHSDLLNWGHFRFSQFLHSHTSFTMTDISLEINSPVTLVTMRLGSWIISSSSTLKWPLLWRIPSAAGTGGDTLGYITVSRLAGMYAWLYHFNVIYQVWGVLTSFKPMVTAGQLVHAYVLCVGAYMIWWLCLSFLCRKHYGAFCAWYPCRIGANHSLAWCRHFPNFYSITVSVWGRHQRRYVINKLTAALPCPRESSIALYMLYMTNFWTEDRSH